MSECAIDNECVVVVGDAGFTVGFVGKCPQRNAALAVAIQVLPFTFMRTQTEIGQSHQRIAFPIRNDR